MMLGGWWKQPDFGVPAGERQGCSAARMWRMACTTLCAPGSDDAWRQIVEVAPPDNIWHTLRNCVAYQAGVWQNMLMKGVADVLQPAAFKLAIVLRHTPSELAVTLLGDLLRMHPQSQDLTSYVLALLTDDESQYSSSSSECSASPCSSVSSASYNSMHSYLPLSHASFARDCMTPIGPAPIRDLKLYGDLELAVLAASKEEYDAHAKLVRAEYSKLTRENYVELRIKVLNQFVQIPRLYHSPEFEIFEIGSRENIEREIYTLREHLLTGRKDCVDKDN